MGAEGEMTEPRKTAFNKSDQVVSFKDLDSSLNDRLKESFSPVNLREILNPRNP